MLAGRLRNEGNPKMAASRNLSWLAPRMRGQTLRALRV
jgi:hypothetical protein